MASTTTMPSEPEVRGAVLQVARVGIVCYGLVHLVIGWISLQLAVGSGGGGQASSQGALAELARQPFGSVLLWAVAAGLAAMVVWQLVSVSSGESWLEGSQRRTEQARHVGRAIVYAALSASALRVVASGSSGSGSQEESMTAALLAAPAGRVLVGLVGLGIIAVGIHHMHSGATKGFTDKLAGAPAGIVQLGRAGYLAKGATLAIVGGLFGWAAATADSDKAGGMDQALQALRQQPLGSWLLGAVALGFAAYGAFCIGWARHPRP